MPLLISCKDRLHNDVITFLLLFQRTQQVPNFNEKLQKHMRGIEPGESKDKTVQLPNCDPKFAYHAEKLSLKTHKTS